MTPALRHGQGAAKVIVMGGWFGTAAHWQGFLDAVDPARFELAVFDYRGYGSRRDEAGPCTFEAAADDVLALADGLGWPRFSLIGHSMGGMAIQRVALAAPERVDRLVGIAPVSAAGSGFDEQRMAMFSQAVASEEARQRIIHFSLGQRWAPAWAAKLAHDSWLGNRAEAMAAYLPQWGTGGFAGEASRLGKPTLVLVGANDPSINLASARSTWLVHHPHAELDEVPNTGHYAMQEAPPAVATRVQQFLAG